MKKDKFSLIATIVAALLLLAVGAFLVLVYLKTGLFGTAALVILLVILCGMFIGMFFLLHSSLRKFVRILICGGMLLLFCGLLLMLFVLLFSIGWMSYSTTDLIQAEGDAAPAQFEEAVSEEFFTIEHFGEPEQAEYAYYEKVSPYYAYLNHYLFCQYSPADYEAQKLLLEDTYIFQTEPMSRYDHAIEPTLHIDGYDFTALSSEAYGLDYPKDMAWIGYNDERCEIVYYFFHNFDLDYVEDMEDQLREDCDWDKLR